MKKRTAEIKLRIPLMTRLKTDLHKRLVRAARDNGRSLNAEIMTRLEESFDIAELRQVVIEAVQAGMNGSQEGERR